jgi:hypothetical protein
MRNLIRVAAVAAALMAPSAAFAVHHAATDNGSGGRLAQMCSEGSRDIAGLPLDQFRKAVASDDAKRAALDELAAATAKAAQDIKAACPSEAPLTAPGRIAAMQSRIEAMIAAVAAVRPPLEKFYGLLNDEQKEQLTSLSQNQRQGRLGSLLDQDCSAQAGVAEWPSADIERNVHPTDAQRASLTALQDAAAKSAEMSKGSCSSENPLTPPARLAAVGKRLDTLLQAVKTVSAPLNDFYAMLDDEQKARFNSIAAPSQQAAQAEPARNHPPVPHFHRHFVSLTYLIRRFFHLF